MFTRLLSLEPRIVMECLTCGRTFYGERYTNCPFCHSSRTYPYPANRY